MLVKRAGEQMTETERVFVEMVRERIHITKAEEMELEG